MMKQKYIYLFLTVLFLSITAFSQQRDSDGNINIKGLSQEDMIRIFGDIYKPGKVFKTDGDPREIRETIVSGNKITTVLFNYGSICKPNYLGNIADLVWNGLGYGFEFGPLAAAEVVNVKTDGSTDTLRVVSDSFVLTGQGSYSPDNTLKWGWLPKPGFADPNSREIPKLTARDNTGDGKPDSWPERWFSPGAGRYLWPAFLGDQATAPDEEVYYVMDDFTNAELPYYPVPSDSSIRGLGMDSEVRVIQYNNPLAESILFVIYSFTNASEKRLDRLYFGMHGDPHVGGPGDYNDDRAFFIPPLGPLADPYPQRARSMVYAWDDDMKGDGGRPAGYFGWKFLESPSNHWDGIDNDDNGIIDESPFNSAGFYIDGIDFPLTLGIADIAKYTAVYGEPRPRWSGDEDGDWDPVYDDIGIDGIGPESPNYPGPDYGEGDGRPSQAFYLDLNGNGKYDPGEPISDDKLPGYLWAGSEPNFGVRDISESDQIGLSSFHAARYTNTLPNVPKNISLMWEWLSSETIDPNQEFLQIASDNVFNFGTGPLSLDIGETQRFSMAILFGWNLDELVLNAETSTRVLESDYRFARPPDKPTVNAVSGDGKVTLYWDDKAEKSFDPFLRDFDFQGYKIYKSQDYTFSDVYTITDGFGNPFMGQAMFDPNTGRRAQFDLIDSLSGFHPVEYLGRAVKYYLGSNTGLVHEYVDSTVNNGVTYFYAVVSYDGGSIEFGLPPSESQAVINRDPITGEFTFDVNTVMVTPGGIPSGMKNAEVGINGKPTAIKGISTGNIDIKVLDDLAVEDRIFTIAFTTPNEYNILDSLGVKESFVSKDTIFVSLNKENIVVESVKLFDVAGNAVAATRFEVDSELGRVKSAYPNALPWGERYSVEYKYYPVFRSNLLRGEDGNASFYGMKVYVTNDSLRLDQLGSNWLNNTEINIKPVIALAPIGNPIAHYRSDWEVRWNDLDTNADGTWKFVADTVMSHLNRPTAVPFEVWDVIKGTKATYRIYERNPLTRNNNRWDWGEDIILQPTGSTTAGTAYSVIFSIPPDSVIPNPVFPKKGDVFIVKTTKPFETGDLFVFESKAVSFDGGKAKANLDDIIVVPNPYVAFSLSEQPGRTAEKRGEQNLQFRNLPPECTVRIYTITGELVQTLYKNNLSNSLSWDLLSYEGQRIAYGVYIYHVDVPGVGEKIGRLAIIK